MEDKQLDFFTALEEAKNKGVYGPTSFDELDEVRSADKRRHELQNILDDFSYLTYNAVYDPEVEDKVSVTRQLVDGLEARMNQVLTSTGDAIKSMLSKVSRRKDEAQDTSLVLKENSTFMVFKGLDGKYRWIARYSNNRLDRDNPPEIISSYSHSRFVKMVDAGVIPLPRLWLWHEPTLEWGAADWVAYDDVGFAVAGGHVYEGCEDIAKSMSNIPASDIRVSHGMPPWSVKYDENNKQIITQHITHEISPLPTHAAANLLTGFVVLEDNNKEVKDMAISDKKKQELSRWGLDLDSVERLEAINQKDATTADDLDIAKKEVTEEAEAVEASAAEPVAEAVAEEQAATVELKADDMEIMNVLTTLSKSVLAIHERLEGIETKVKEYDVSEGQRLARKAANTPLASMASLLNDRIIGSAVGDERTRVDGRTTLAKSAPVETKEEATSSNPFPWISKMIADQREA